MSDCKSKIAEAFTRLWNYEKANKGGFKIKAYKDALDKLLLIPAIPVEPWSCVTISGPKPRPSSGLPKLGYQAPRRS